MTPSERLKTPSFRPCNRFVTTYSNDYRPFTERHLQFNQLKPRPEAKPAPTLIKPPQTGREAWPACWEYFYRTTNSTYGSAVSQLPCCSLRVASSPPLGPVTSAPVAEGFTLTQMQEVVVTMETGPSLDAGEKGQMNYVYGGNVNVPEKQEATVLYEEGVIVLSSHAGSACCEDFHRSVCREAGLQHLLDLPLSRSNVMMNKCPGRCFEMHSSTSRAFPLVNVRSTLCSSEPWGKLRPSQLLPSYVTEVKSGTIAAISP